MTHENHTTTTRTRGYGHADGTETTVCLTCDAVIGTSTTKRDERRARFHDAEGLADDYRERFENAARELSRLADELAAANDLLGNEYDDHGATRTVWHRISDAMRLRSPLGRLYAAVRLAESVAWDSQAAAHDVAREYENA